MSEAEAILHKLAAVLKRVDRADERETSSASEQDPIEDPPLPESDDPPSV
ncbi:MAG: hypothetical protein GWN73_17145, partial [Actinobacteria bacterium]|nr:hypothetical protein [Actinomycetota bacterium]